MANVLSISGDLMLGSRVQESLGAAGHEVTTTPSIEESSWDGVDLIVADLDLEAVFRARHQRVVLVA